MKTTIASDSALDLSASPLVDAVVDRGRSRLVARDRLDALDEATTGITIAARARDDPAIIAGLVDDALDDILAALAVRDNRQALRALSDGGSTGALDQLMRAGLVIDSWTGDAPRASVPGSRLLALLDEVRSAASANLDSSLGDRDTAG